MSEAARGTGRRRRPSQHFLPRTAVDPASTSNGPTGAPQRMGRLPRAPIAAPDRDRLTAGCSDRGHRATSSPPKKVRRGCLSKKTPRWRVRRGCLSISGSCRTLQQGRLSAIGSYRTLRRERLGAIGSYRTLRRGRLGAGGSCRILRRERRNGGGSRWKVQRGPSGD